MKASRLPGLLLGLFSAAGAARAQEPFTYETPDRLFSTGDWNGDGFTDAVVLDRSTGALTFGFQSGTGEYVWSNGPASGAASPTSLTVGRQGNHDVAGVTSPDFGRIVFIDIAHAGAQPTLREIFPKTPSPRSMAFFPLNSATNPELLVVGDLGNGAADRYNYELRPALNGAATPIWESAFPEETARIAATVVEAGAPPRVLEYYDGTLHIEGVSPAGITPVPGPLDGAVTNPSTLYAQGNFDGTAYTQYLFYNPGSGAVRTAKITEPAAGTYAWSALTTFSLPNNIRLLTTLPKTGGGHRLGVIFTDGSASLYNYTGSGVPSLYRSLTPAGSGAADLLLPAGPDAVLITRGGQWQRFLTKAADPLTPSGSGVFSPPGAASAVSNIIWLTAEAFARPDASVTGTGQYREWTTAASGGGTSWTVTSLVTSGSSGLSASSFTTRTAPAETKFPLLNQVRPNVSIHLTDAPPGAPAGGIVMAPPGGVYPPGDRAPGAGAPVAWITGTNPATLPASLKYDQPPAGGELIKIPHYLTVSLQPVRPGDSVRYRINDGPWAVLGSQSRIELYGNAVVESYAFTAATRSPIRRQSYTFSPPGPLAPGTSADLDRDGMSDEWEKTFAAGDPNADPDGDGATNKEEFEGGTDPNDRASTPPPAQRLVLNAASTTDATGRPVLRLEWPAGDNTVVLESAASLSDRWDRVTTGITTVGGNNRYDVNYAPPAAPRNFYRLRRP